MRRIMDSARVCSGVERELDRFRRQAGEVLEIPVAGLDEYAFHCTLGYRLTQCDDGAELVDAEGLYVSWIAEQPRVEIEDVAFCIFNDMQSFPLLYFH
ncbi:hypothetical protein [Corynebacterium sanguinis]|uniref:hypothetical protein n=1 Tax=Corynebacterium sanguinis TaxID=2594913 RepID=UPI0021A39F6F|nr:hypothetical protein [Corynebacterium sanguinis]MCT1462955.1 hypothetical protein [Corynebacterium sanguinis]MCT2329439.1 hypothetical protein [Corynebacterium sanguinis]